MFAFLTKTGVWLITSTCRNSTLGFQKNSRRETWRCWNAGPREKCLLPGNVQLFVYFFVMNFNCLFTFQLRFQLFIYVFEKEKLSRRKGYEECRKVPTVDCFLVLKTVPDLECSPEAYEDCIDVAKEVERDTLYFVLSKCLLKLKF